MSYRITTSTGEVDIIEVVDWEQIMEPSGPELFTEPLEPEPTEHCIPIPFVPIGW